jgi:hypothetical protein
MSDLTARLDALYDEYNDKEFATVAAEFIIAWPALRVRLVLLDEATDALERIDSRGIPQHELQALLVRLREAQQ